MRWKLFWTSVSSTILVMSANSCRIETSGQEDCDTAVGYISSESVFCAGAGDTRSSDGSGMVSCVTEEDDIGAVLSVSVSEGSAPAFTRSALVWDMYSDFAFGVDEMGGSKDVIRCGVDNERMTSTGSGSYRSSKIYSTYYTCRDCSDVVCLWGYAPYMDANPTYLEDGRRLVGVTVEDPLSQNDVLVMKNVTDKSRICLSPVESALRFQHILTAVNFHYHGSPGISGVIDSLRITGINDSGQYNLYEGGWTYGGKVHDWCCFSGVEFSPDDHGKSLLGEGESLLFVPQTFSSDASIEIDYSLRVGSSGSVRKGTLTASLPALGEWESGMVIDYILSFTDKLQPRIESSSPDTMSWNWSEGQETVRIMYVFGENLDASTPSPELYGEDGGHWKIASVDFKDNGRSAEVSLYPVCSAVDGGKEAQLRFHYPDVTGSGVAEAALVHKPLDTDTQIFAAMKKNSYDSASDLSDGFVAVRPDRDGHVYMYLNNDGKWGSENSLGVPGGAGFEDWTADFDVLESGYGIRCDYDELTHRLSFSVSDTMTFMSHILEVPQLSCRLNSGKKLSVNVKLMPDFSVEGLDDFYVGMKRYLSTSGFCGNLSMKTTATSGLLRYGDDRKCMSTAPVPMQALYSYGGGTSELVIVSDDDFNDPEFHAEVGILDPAPTGSLSERDLFIHGDEAVLSVHYNDKYGNIIPTGRFDRQSYDELLSCELEFRQYRDEAFLGTEHYDVRKVDDTYLCFVSSVPEDYKPEMEYAAEIVACAAYDRSVQTSVTTTVPAFDANDVSVSTAKLDDYLSLNPAEGISTCSKHTFSYGVKSVDDLQCEVRPCSVDSYDNDCITAAISDKSDGRLTFLLKDPDSDDELVTHSVGRHKVLVSTFNKHSGERICRTESCPYLNVYIHASVGTGVYLTDYSEDNGFTACFFGEKLGDLGKCSLEELEGREIVRPVSSEYSGDLTIYKWKSLAIRADIEADMTGTFMGEDNPYLIIRFSLNGTGSGEYEIEDAINILNGVWNDPEGDAFFGHGGLYGTVPGMKFYNGSKTSVENIRHSDLVDEYGFGYYYVHTLEAVDDSSRGWLNIIYDLGMPHDGYSF